MPKWIRLVESSGHEFFVDLESIAEIDGTLISYKNGDCLEVSRMCARFLANLITKDLYADMKERNENNAE